MRRFAAVLLCLSVALGCGKEEVENMGGPVAGKGDTKVIGVSMLTLTNPFFKVIADNIEAEGAKHGYTTILTSGERDVAKQKDQIKDFIVLKVSAIVLSPCDSRSIGSAIKEANEAGIPVFTVDIACLDPSAKVVCHIATDNYGGGRQAGEVMIEALGEAGGKVAILHFEQAESCQLRVKGFNEVIDAYNKGRKNGQITVVATLPGGGVRDEGYKAAEDALQANPDLAGIFAINDPSALGAYSALEKANKADQVKIIAFDGQDFGKQAIKDGKIYADPIQFPDRMGKLAVEFIVKYSNGEEVPAEKLLPTELYRQADGLKDPSLK